MDASLSWPSWEKAKGARPDGPALTWQGDTCAGDVPGALGPTRASSPNNGGHVSTASPSAPWDAWDRMAGAAPQGHVGMRDITLRKREALEPIAGAGGWRQPRGSVIFVNVNSQPVHRPGGIF